MYKVTFLEFDEIDLSNWKNNYSTSGQSSYMSNNPPFNFPFNSPPVLTGIKNPLMPLFSVSSPQGSEQHLYSLNVFSLLPLFNSQPSTVDSPTDSSTDTFENLLFYFAYGSSFSPPSFPYNTFTVTTTSQEEFKTFSKLPVHIFSSFSSFYYALHSLTDSKSH
jgi:hypothetical protein